MLSHVALCLLAAHAKGGRLRTRGLLLFSGSGVPSSLTAGIGKDQHSEAPNRGT